MQGPPSTLHLNTPPSPIKTWGPVIQWKVIQFSYWINYFIPSCGIKFILFWSAFCVYKSFKFICFRCCGNCVVNWIPKCLSWFQSHDKEPEHLRVGVRTETGGEGINIPHSSTGSYDLREILSLWQVNQELRNQAANEKFPLKWSAHSWLCGLLCRNLHIAYPEALLASFPILLGLLHLPSEVCIFLH